MDIVSRGFSGRRSADNAKLPPGQYLTTDFPVLSAGPTPHVSRIRARSISSPTTGLNFFVRPNTVTPSSAKPIPAGLLTELLGICDVPNRIR